MCNICIIYVFLQSGSNALMMAVQSCRAAVVRVLLEAGAKVNDKNNVCVYVCVCVCACIHVCMCVYIYICVYVCA